MRSPSRLPGRERGTTLLIALVFLVILTLFAVSGMNTGIVNLRTANNAQLMIEAQFAAQQQIEALLSSAANFHYDKTVPPATPWPTDTTTNVLTAGGYTDFSITASRPRCVNVRNVDIEYSDDIVKAGQAPREHYWVVEAVATDGVFGTKATVRQGIKIRLAQTYTCVP